ncbi:TBC1 domain family member 7 [Halotydeus destructor]|nr:TBC1 domain family member 7 [Halotydeus destructor]
MANEERENVRNFRSAYYEKVGCRGVEEKKTLERLLLNESPLDLENLQEFTRRFSLPSSYREPVWTLLLDIASSVTEIDQFITSEQRALSNNLIRALYFLDLVDDETPDAKRLAVMFLLETGKLDIDVETQLKANGRTILAITSSFEVMKNSTPFQNDYWLIRQFLLKLQSLRMHIPEMVSKCTKCLCQQDSALHNHLVKFGALECIELWFEKCFAGILHENVLIRVWDKVIAGSYQKLLPLIAILVITNNKQKIVCESKVLEIRKFFTKPLSKDASELIFSQMVECDTKLR